MPVHPDQTTQDPLLPPVSKAASTPGKNRASDIQSRKQNDGGLLPPGFKSKKRKAEQTSTEKRTENKPEKKLPTDPQAVLLPPTVTSQPKAPSASKKKKSSKGKTGRKKNRISGALLPQKATPGSEASLLPAANKDDTGGDLLPQATTAKSSPRSAPQGGDSSTPLVDEAVGENLISEDEKVVLPDGKGGFVEVSERKTTVNYRGAKIELSSMNREDREVSRTLNNFIAITFSIILLVTLMIVLGWYNSPS